MSKTTYFAADTPFQAERERLSILERLFDARTKEFLTELGVAKGWQCCDVGAGGGSITRWLAQAVGPAGRVVAVDQNTRFLEDIELPNVDVLKADILSDLHLEGSFDLVFTRLLLLHLDDPEKAVRRMVNLAKPGGLIFAIDLDVSIMSAADPSHPSSLRFDAARQRVNASVRERREPAYRMGRRLPGLFEKMGLVEVSNSAWTSVTRGGSLEAEFWRLTYETWKTAWTSEGVLTIEELQLLISAMTDESFRFLDGLWFKISGRKPH